MRAALYCRISSDKTGEALGVQRQEGDCKRLAEAKGWTVTEVLVDNDRSAFSGKGRPEYDRLLSLIKSGHVDVVVAWSHDRLHRRPTELEKYIDISERAKVDTYTVKAGHFDLSTPSGRAVARTLAAWANYETETSTARVKAAKLQSAMAGKFSGGQRPYGYEPGCTAIREEEAAVVRELAERVIDGESFNRLAIDLNRRGIRTTHGKEWNSLKVRNLLRHKRYAGIREHHDAEYEAQWPAILSRETWDDLQAAIQRSASMYKQRGPGRKYLLSGFVYCGVCGLKMHTKPRAERGSSTRYVCTKHRTEGPDGCGKVSRNIAPVDLLIAEAIIYRLDTENLAQALRDRETDSGELLGLMSDRDAKQHRLNELVDDYGSGLLDRGQFTRAKATAEAALADAKRKLEAHTRAEAGAQLLPVGTRVQDAWDQAAIEWRRRLVGLLIEQVVIHPSNTTGMAKADRWHGYVFKPEDIEVAWLK